MRSIILKEWSTIMENQVEVTQEKKTRRLDYLDIAKFIAIILVILGHTTGNLDSPLYRIILYAFHMPLFFIVSGVVVKKHRHEYGLKHWVSFFRKNILALVVPYLIWALIYSKFQYEMFPKLFYASIESIETMPTLSSLWFLPCLFVARIFVELVMMLSSYFEKINRHLFALIFAVIFFTIGFLIPHPSQGLPWCVDIAFVAAGFILLGYSIKDILSKLFDKPIWIHIIISIVSLGLFVGGILIQQGNPYIAIMARAMYGNIALFLSNSIFGSIFILDIAMIITKLFQNHKSNVVNRFMLWTGRSTIGIYLIHKNFLQEVCMANLSKWGVQLPNLGFAILATIVTFIYSVLIVFIIDRYVPQLFGKFPSKKIIVVKEEDCQEPNMQN